MALALNLQKWLKCSYSLLYTYIIQQKVDENSQTYQVKLLSYSNIKFS